MNDDIVEIKEDDEKDMDIIHASATEIVVKPKDVEDFKKKAKAKKRTLEEEKKLIEDNVMDDEICD